MGHVPPHYAVIMNAQAELIETAEAEAMLAAAANRFWQNIFGERENAEENGDNTDLEEENEDLLLDDSIDESVEPRDEGANRIWEYIFGERENAEENGDNTHLEEETEDLLLDDSIDESVEPRDEGVAGDEQPNLDATTDDGIEKQDDERVTIEEDENQPTSSAKRRCSEELEDVPRKAVRVEGQTSVEGDLEIL